MRNGGIVNTKLAEGIFEILLAGPLVILDIISATSTTKHGMIRNLRRMEKNPENRPSHKIITYVKEWHRDYSKYHAFLKRLEKQGLVAASGDHGRRTWTLTAKGVTTHKSFKTKRVLLEESISPGGVTMVSYDVPERLRSERDSLREILKLFRFTYVHQSLWYINATVEKSFIEFLRERKLIDYVHIFQISKTGTLESIN